MPAPMGVASLLVTTEVRPGNEAEALYFVFDFYSIWSCYSKQGGNERIGW